MYSQAQIAGHPIHPMLVAFPIVFYTMTFISFFVYQFVSPQVFWYQMAYFNNMAAVGTAILAAIPGFIDWAFGIPNESAAKSRGLAHMALNVGALVLFGWNALRIRGTFNLPPEDVTFSLVLSLIGMGLVIPAAYHGFELIATHKVGVAMTPEQQRLEPTKSMSRSSHESWT